MSSIGFRINQYVPDGVVAKHSGLSLRVCFEFWSLSLFHKRKQEAHGPHRSPEKTVQIIKQIWLYHNVDSENKEKTLWEFIGSSFEQTWIPFTQGSFVPRLVEIGPVILEKNILKFLKVYFHYFIIISPWKRATHFIWTNLYPLHPRMLCAKFG